METIWRQLIILIFTSTFIVFQARSLRPTGPNISFRVELTRVDMNHNFSKFELIQRAARRSHHRLARLTAGSMKSLVSSSINRTTSAAIRPGNGEFLMDLSIGTPAVGFSAIVDTGSDLIWTQCEPCQDCFDQPTPIFNPSKSSTYSTIPCSHPLCTALPSSSCSPSGDLCDYLYTYGDSSSTQGVLSADAFRIASAAVPSIAFGCGDENQGAGFSQGGGLIGLGRGPLSLLSQLNLTRFSYCLTPLSDASETSPFFFGEAAELQSTAVQATLLRNADQSSFYYLSLNGISVGGQKLQIPEALFQLREDGGGGVIIDSGTSITYLEEEAYSAVKKAILEGTKLPPAEDSGDAGLDTCFMLPEGTNEVQVPKLVLHFDGAGAAGRGNLELPPENYMVLDSSTGLLCLTLMGSKGISILGNFQQQNLHILYDLDKQIVSFQPTRCGQL